MVLRGFTVSPLPVCPGEHDGEVEALRQQGKGEGEDKQYELAGLRIDFRIEDPERGSNCNKSQEDKDGCKIDTRPGLGECRAMVEVTNGCEALTVT